MFCQNLTNLAALGSVTSSTPKIRNVMHSLHQNGIRSRNYKQSAPRIPVRPLRPIEFISYDPKFSSELRSLFWYRIYYQTMLDALLVNIYENLLIKLDIKRFPRFPRFQKSPIAKTKTRKTRKNLNLQNKRL